MSDPLELRAIELGYNGKLLTPPFSAGTDGQPMEDRLLNYADQMIERVELLMVHYGIEGSEPHDLIQLVVSLASDWVPGFGAVYNPIPPRRRGRPTNRMKKFYDFELFTSIERLQFEDPKRNLGAACRLFPKRNPNHERWSSVSPAALENNYRRIATKLNDNKNVLKSLAANASDFASLIEGVKNAYARRYGR